MRISYHRSGGYLGRIEGCELDTDTLPSDEATRVRSLVDQSGVLSYTGDHRTPRARDMQLYHFVIDEGGNRVEVSFDDGTLPPSAQELVTYLDSKCTSV